MMYYTIWDDAEWKTQPIIQGGNPYALVLDSANNPHILYPGSNGVTYYASLGAHGWSYQVAPSGSRYSLSLDSSGMPHIAYASNLLVKD